METAVLCPQDLAGCAPTFWLFEPSTGTPPTRIGFPERQSPTKDEASSSDSACLAKVREGDEDAARILVERLYPTIVRCVRRHLPQRTSQEDLVQAVFIKIFRKLHQFSGKVPLEHWVSRIAINTCLNQLKHETLRREVRMADLSAEQEAVVEHLVVRDEELPAGSGGAARELLEKLLAGLTPAERQVVTLLHLEERSIAEIAQMTGWSVPSVKIRAFRARRRLRGLWKSLLSSERL